MPGLIEAEKKDRGDIPELVFQDGERNGGGLCPACVADWRQRGKG
jgi:hypothetical protein